MALSKKVFAFDLDGTLTEHRTWINDENLAALDIVRASGVRVVIAGAGQARRIFAQMREYKVDIIGNYGLQYSVYDETSGGLRVVRDLVLPCDKHSVEERIGKLREACGYREYTGDSVEFHPTGCVTFPLLGTRADIADKLLFDPDRAKRRAIFDEIAAAFPEYSVFVGGSSSFDMVPKPYSKYYALDALCREEGIDHAELTYFGDDYGTGGNDACVRESDFDFVGVDRPAKIPALIDEALAALK